MLIDHLCSE